MPIGTSHSFFILSCWKCCYIDIGGFSTLTLINVLNCLLDIIVDKIVFYAVVFFRQRMEQQSLMRKVSPGEVFVYTIGKNVSKQQGGTDVLEVTTIHLDFSLLLLSMHMPVPWFKLQKETKFFHIVRYSPKMSYVFEIFICICLTLTNENI